MQELLLAQLRGALEKTGNQAETPFSPSIPPPEIEAILLSHACPLWSVMIPTYHCTQYLAETLRSVLVQDPGPAQMQIEVVDDHSTRDDPETLVRSIGRGRVAFHRHPQNVGAVKNFNACIRRAQGQWVHILHGDDLVEPGFYQALESCMRQHPQAALLATRSYHIDMQGTVSKLPPRCSALESFTTDPSPFFLINPLRTPAVVVRRDFYQQHGGFREALVHTADCDMWSRAVARQGGVMTGEPLACYRDYSQNDTSRLMRTAENLRDTVRLGLIFAQSYPQFDLLSFGEMLRIVTGNQLQQFRELGDSAAIQAHQKFYDLLPVTGLCQEGRLKRFCKSLPLARRWVAAVRQWRNRRAGLRSRKKAASERSHLPKI